MKKYYADINLIFDDMKYGIVGEMKKQEMIDQIKDFAHKMKLDCNTRNKTFTDAKGNVVGKFTITSKIM